MTFNVEYGGQWYDLSKAADIIQASGADVVAIQEAYTENGTNTIPHLAAMLGWNYLGTTDFNNDSTIISKWPIELVTRSLWYVSARITPPMCATCPNTSFYVISAHYTDEPYQPFQAANISYNDSAPFIHNSDELSAAAYAARGKAIDDTIAEAQRILLRPDATTVLIAGDFNEPSNLDWTPRSAQYEYVPYACDFVNSRNFSRHGLIDTYRQLFPDEIANRGISWPGYKVDYQYREDRIDFIYHSNVTRTNTRQHRRMGDETVVTLRAINATVVQGYSPSDHRAVYAQFEFVW